MNILHMLDDCLHPVDKIILHYDIRTIDHGSKTFIELVFRCSVCGKDVKPIKYARVKK